MHRQLLVGYRHRDRPGRTGKSVRPGGDDLAAPSRLDGGVLPGRDRHGHQYRLG